MDSQDQRLRWMKSYGGFEQLLDLRWDNYEVHEGNKRAVWLLENKTSLAVKHAPGLFLHGTVGSGKTHLIAAILNSFIDWKIQLQESGHSSPVTAFWISMSFYIESLRESPKLRQRAFDAGVLFIDDFGTKDATPWVMDQIYQLIEHRSSRRLQTFITSNVSLEDIRAKYDERVESRIKGLCIPVQIKGQDRRPEQLLKKAPSIKAVPNDRKE